MRIDKSLNSQVVWAAQALRSACRSPETATAVSNLERSGTGVFWTVMGSTQKTREGRGCFFWCLFLAWLPLQSLAMKKKKFVVLILGGEKPLKFFEKCW